LSFSSSYLFFRRPSRRWQDQKTFSVGPRSFNIKELWFPVTGCASGSNPFLTRDTIESPAKILRAAPYIFRESRRFQSNRRASAPTPSLANARLSKVLKYSSLLIKESGRFQSSLRAFKPTPLLVRDRSRNIMP